MVQLPALFALMPGVAPPPLLGTNKLASAIGTTGAAIQYARSTATPWSAVIPCMIVAFVAALAGAYAVIFIPAEPLKKALPFILAALLIYTWASGAGRSTRRSVRARKPRSSRRPGAARSASTTASSGSGPAPSTRCFSGAGSASASSRPRPWRSSPTWPRCWRCGRVRGHRLHLLGAWPIHGGGEFRRRPARRAHRSALRQRLHSHRVLRRGCPADRQDLQGRLPVASRPAISRSGCKGREAARAARPPGWCPPRG